MAACITSTKAPPSSASSATPAVLFVHGTPTHSYEYRHLIPALSATVRCIAQWLLDRIGLLRRLPVLIVWGVKDSAFEPHQLWRQLQPEARIVRIDTAGHRPHEEEPAQVITRSGHSCPRRGR